MSKGLFKRIGNTAVPADADGREAFYAVKDGATFVVDISAPKNQEQVELFFALRDLVCEATDAARTPVKEWLLEQAGFVEIDWYPDGMMRLRPKSIRGMQQVEFNQFFQAVLPKIQKALGVDRPSLLARFFDLLDPNLRAAARRRLRATSSPPLAPARAEGSEESEEVAGDGGRSVA